MSLLLEAAPIRLPRTSSFHSQQTDSFRAYDRFVADSQKTVDETPLGLPRTRARNAPRDQANLEDAHAPAASKWAQDQGRTQSLPEMPANTRQLRVKAPAISQRLL